MNLKPPSAGFRSASAPAEDGVSMSENNETNIQSAATGTTGTPPRRSRKKMMWIGAAVVTALSIGGVGTAVAADQIGDDQDALSGDALQRATDEALAETGGGDVIDAEREDGAATRSRSGCPMAVSGTCT
jgi:hypothetical protein